MSDHELCLLAAKAAGYMVEDKGKLILRTYTTGLTALWNPLEYAQDAFDLMVDCLIELMILEDITDAHSVSEYAHHGISEDHGTDKHAATRRAIVRAAAAMGDDK